MHPSSAPMDKPPSAPDAIMPEAESTPMADPIPPVPVAVCTRHTVVTYDGPSDVLVLRIRRGERLLVTPELDTIVDSLMANGHVFTQED